MKYKRIPDETVRRLPVYLRGLMFLREDGRQNISSSSLADFVGVHSWQIRKDFSYFGEFGVRGVGYEVDKLVNEIKGILRLNVVQKAALVGAGHLGTAILSYPGFEIYGFDVTAAFDNNPKKIGKTIKNITIMDVAKIDILRKNNITLGIIAVPRSAAQETAHALVKAG